MPPDFKFQSFSDSANTADGFELYLLDRLVWSLRCEWYEVSFVLLVTNDQESQLIF